MDHYCIIILIIWWSISIILIILTILIIWSITQLCNPIFPGLYIRLMWHLLYKSIDTENILPCTEQHFNILSQRTTSRTSIFFPPSVHEIFIDKHCVKSFFQFHGKSWLTKYTLLQSLMGGIFINTFLLIIVSPGTQIKMLVLKSFSRKLSNLFGPGVHYRIPGRRSRISQCHK